MNALHSSTQSDATDPLEAADESDASDLTSDILPSCFLLGIIAGFAAFVAFSQAVLPALVAAVLGALGGLLFACEEQRPPSADSQ
jgi:hypothetical protein